MALTRPGAEVVICKHVVAETTVIFIGEVAMLCSLNELSMIPVDQLETVNSPVLRHKQHIKWLTR